MLRETRALRRLLGVILGLLAGPALAQQAVPPPAAPAPTTATRWTLLAEGLAGGAVNWRTLAILHVAMHDSLNAAAPRFARFAAATAEEPPAAGALPALAMAAAAHQVLVLRHPEEAARSDALLAEARAEAGGEAGLRLGAAIGRAAVLRHAATTPEGRPFPVSERPGAWRATPPDHDRAQLADYTPFLVPHRAALRGPRPPAHGTPAYVAGMEEVRRLGGQASAHRLAEQTEAAVFWANQTSQRGFLNLALRLLAEQGAAEDHWRQARVLAQLSLTLADGFVLAWADKEHFATWRPVTALTRGGGGVAAEPGWAPLIPTPPHPEHPSGHATDCSGGAHVLAAAFPTAGPVTYVAVDASPATARRYPGLVSVAEDCANSRLWAGVHVRRANEEGLRLGREIARRATAAMAPLR
jgi:hypothetical protein